MQVTKSCGFNKLNLVLDVKIIVIEPQGIAQLIEFPLLSTFPKNKN